MRSIVITAISLLFITLACAQELRQENWQNLDVSANNVEGVSVEKAYSDLLKGKSSTEVIVAILDSGVDVEHEDLAGQIWVNEDEIPGNGIDDDNNGYIDDINGWNFIGGPDGDVHYDNLEFTRIYKELKGKFEKKKSSDISSSEKDEYAKYLKFSSEFDSRVEKAKKEQEEFMFTYKAFEMAKSWAKKQSGRKKPTLEEVKELSTNSERNEALKDFLILIMENDAESQLEEGKKHFDNTLDYMYNLDFESRDIVGDNYDDITEKYYGNNNVEGPDATHGTHVAGIVAALRGNELGGDGIATNVKIMSVRVVPDGDERDKDVANAIRYAVDNGAKIINMSFGKSYSPGKSAVDQAAKYASDRGVLIVHAAGNSSKNIDKANNFPNDTFENGESVVENWIEVGSTAWMGDRELVSSFSNYGKMSVDIFAPGSDIFSTIPNDEYEFLSGTSMAAPTLSGVAALVWSYYPDLTASELKQILLNSSENMKKRKVELPGGKKKTKFKKLSRTGGVVNAYNALKLAALKS